MHDCLNDQPARTVCKVAQSEIYACLADARARAARLIQPARRAPLNAGIKSFPTRDRRPSETEIQIAQKSPNMHSQKMGAGPCCTCPTGMQASIELTSLNTESGRDHVRVCA